MCFITSLIGQTYPDHFGEGNTIGVSVTSSPLQNSDSTSHSLDGTGYIVDKTSAARFLAQASLGSNYEDIHNLSEIGINVWLDQQMSMPYISFNDEYDNIFEEIADSLLTYGIKRKDIYRLSDYSTYAFYQKIFKHKDKLRQKVAFALSQLFVIHRNANGLFNRGFGITDFYNTLYEGAFGNFRTLIENVTYHPIMGEYLSHINNAEEDLLNNTKPDENFARELMQLFTIGLNELNNDGSLKLDALGQSIPTYYNKDIEQLAKVFTGLSGGGRDSLAYIGLNSSHTNPPNFNMHADIIDYTRPMNMNDSGFDYLGNKNDYHDSSQKMLFTHTDNPLFIPANQSGDQDIKDVLDYLFHHSNIGPFIALRLIQQLVKSSPSSAYINRVASAFNNNGHNIRGDMSAVIKAILLDPEARDCNEIQNPKGGKLLQPMERFINLMVALNLETSSNRYWINDQKYIMDDVNQSFLFAPSVFNFFRPDYQHDNSIVACNMYSPEFQILNNNTSIQYINRLKVIIQNDIVFYNYTKANDLGNRMNTINYEDAPILNFQSLVDLIDISKPDGFVALMDHLNLILCRGQLSAESKTMIIDALHHQSTLTSFPTSAFPETLSLEEKMVREAIYFIMLSPDFLILK